MKSMTGFGRSLRNKNDGLATPKSGVKPDATVESSIRAVNGRFLEIRVHLPREWGELEGEARTLVQSRVARGTVDLYVNRSKGRRAEAKIEVNRPLAEQWSRALQELAKVMAVSGSAGSARGEIPLSLLANAPDVIQVDVESELSMTERKAVLKTVEEAIDALDREREREGVAIQAELRELLAQLETVVAKVGSLAKEAPDDLRARLKTRLDRLGAAGLNPPESSDARFHQEVALLIDRGDIREEIARLAAHLKIYGELIGPRSSHEPLGKTLDFYAQELLREVNTVGSKSQTVELTRAVVEAKTLVEKIREQVQNIE